MRSLVGGSVFVRAILFFVFAVPTFFSSAQQTAPAPAAAAPASAGKALTVERIYGGEPSLNGRLTKGIAWTPDSKQLSFLETKGSGKDAKTELWVMDVATGARRALLSAEKLEAVLPADSEKTTQATGLGRHAPAEYQWAPSGGALLFQGATSLAWFDLKTQTSHTLVSGKEGIADPKISPDGRFVSFVRDHNLWLISLADGKERALTQGGTEEVRKGELDWVYPEELDITTAYWWAPDSSAIAYLQMDESKVAKYPLVDFSSPEGDAEEERYPPAGGANPIVRVFVAPVSSGGEARAMDTGENTDVYIARVNWLTDSKHVAIQRLNRPQTELDLLIADTASGEARTALTEKDQYWINISNDLHFLKDGKRFLWSSERSGYRHLYLYDLDGKEQAQLTKGEWEVSAVDAVDEGKGLVYFTGTSKSPLERHLYRVSLDGSAVSRITIHNGTHRINMAPDASAFVDTYSDVMTPPRQDLAHADGSLLRIINENKVAELADYHLVAPQFLTVKTHDGVLLNGWMIKPPDFDASRKYPVLIYTYGGPHAQVVLNMWENNTGLWHQEMAQKGYIIFALDNRGSAGRGHLFEEPIHYRFGAQELSDQRDGVDYLKSLPYVDASRIGIWGWSYGGHMTLHAMFEAGNVFKAGFAGGPVTDWFFYDSIYTERYLGLLPQNAEGYRSSSPLEKAAGLKGKLLIAHGTGDDNVHFANTLSLINELLEHGKYVEVMPFPGRGHGVSDPPARKVLMNRVTQFFLDNL
jgi:dipeptidyl-peptidase 4